MSKRSKCAPRCDRCRMHQARCLCQQIPTFYCENTKLVLVMHRREVKKTTATGPLALLALKNSILYIHGKTHEKLDLRHLHDEGRRVLVLFPTENARPLTEDLKNEDQRPITLVVPDGSWTQAGRIPKRVPGLEYAEKIALPLGQKSNWGIRHEPHEEGLATFEGIARAFGILESSLIEAELLDFFKLVVQNTLATRGQN